MAYYTVTVPGLANFPVTPKGNVVVSAMALPTFKSKVASKTKSAIPLGLSTGRIAISTDDLRFLFWVEIKSTENNATGWVWYTEYAIKPVKEFQKLNVNRAELFKKFSTDIQSKIAQAYLDKTVENDQKIFLLTLQNIKVMRTIQAKGVNTREVEKKLLALAKSYNARQLFLRKNTKATVGAWDKVKNAFADAANWLGINGMPNSGQINYLQPTQPNLGVLPIVVVGAIILAVLSAGAALALNNWLQPKYSETEKDLEISTELDKALKTLDPETRQEVVNDLEKQIDTAYNQGKKDQKKDGDWNISKYIGIGIASILFVTVGIPALQRAGQGQSRPSNY